VRAVPGFKSVFIWEILRTVHVIWLWMLRGMARRKKKVALLATTVIATIIIIGETFLHPDEAPALEPLQTLVFSV